MARTDVTQKVAGVFDAALEPITSTLNTALNRKIAVRISDIRPTDITVLASKLPDEIVVAQAEFSTGFTEGFDYVLPTDLAARLADLMLMGEGDAEFKPDDHLDGIAELLNQINGVLSTYWTELKGSPVKLRPVTVAMGKVENLTAKWESCFQADLELKIEGFDDREIILQISPQMIADLEELSSADSDTVGNRPPPAVLDDDMLAETEDQTSAPEVRPAAFEDFGPDTGGGSSQSIEALMDLELPIIIELGRTSMFIRDILALSPGSIVELNKLSGEPVDLYINDKRFARGEVVVIDENFGIRIVDLVKVEDRIRSLK